MTCLAVIISYLLRLNSKFSRYVKKGAARYRVALFDSKTMAVGGSKNIKWFQVRLWFSVSLKYPAIWRGIDAVVIGNLFDGKSARFKPSLILRHALFAASGTFEIIEALQFPLDPSFEFQ